MDTSRIIILSVNVLNQEILYLMTITEIHCCQFRKLSEYLLETLFTYIRIIQIDYLQLT